MSAGVVEASAAPAVIGGLHAKLAEVMAEVGRVPKRGRNEFHKYWYATEADIVEAVRGALSSRGVSLIPSITEVLREGTLTTVLMEFQFADGATGETSTHKWAGTGDDKGDKGLYKAMTGALKYFLLKTFLMPTGDDPEADESTDKRAHGERKPKAKQCLRCSANAEPNSDYCTTCNRLMAERLADDALKSAGLKPALPDISAGVRPFGLAPEANDPVLRDDPPTDVKKERQRAFAIMEQHGFDKGDAGRPDRLRLYAKALGRAAVTENDAKKMTAVEWRAIGDRVRDYNKPPPEDRPTVAA